MPCGQRGAPIWRRSFPPEATSFLSKFNVFPNLDSYTSALVSRAMIIAVDAVSKVMLCATLMTLY